VLPGAIRGAQCSPDLAGIREALLLRKGMGRLREGRRRRKEKRTTA